jgi:hypothetical protein
MLLAEPRDDLRARSGDVAQDLATDPLRNASMISGGKPFG